MKLKLLLILFVGNALNVSCFAADLDSVLKKTSSMLKQIPSLKNSEFRAEFDIVSMSRNEAPQTVTNVLFHKSEDVFRVDECGANGCLTIAINGDKSWTGYAGKVDAVQTDRVREAARLLRWLNAATALEYLDSSSDFELIDNGLLNVGNAECRMISFVQATKSDTVHFLIGSSDSQLEQCWLSFAVPNGRATVKINYQYISRTGIGIANEVFTEQIIGNSKKQMLIKTKYFATEKLDDALFEPQVKPVKDIKE